MKIDEVIESGKQLEQAVPKPGARAPAPAPAKVIPFPRTAPKVSPGVAANDPKFKQGIIQKYGQKAWDYVSKFGLQAAARAGVIAGAALTPSNVAQAYNFPQEGPLKGSEINPVTNKPWTPGELEQYKLDPEKYAKQKPVTPTPGPDQSDAETARLQRQAQPIGDPVKEPAAPPKPAPAPTITPAEPEPAPAPAPAPAPKVEPEVKPPAQTAPAPKPIPGPDVKPDVKPELAPAPAPRVEPTPKPEVKPDAKPTTPMISPIVTPDTTTNDAKKDWWRYGGMPGGKVGAYVPDSKLKENKKMIHSALVERWNKFKEAEVNAADPEAQTFVPPLNAKVQPTAAAKQADPKNTGTAQDPEAQTFVGTTTNPVTPAARAVARAAKQQPEPTPLPSVLRTEPAPAPAPPTVPAPANAIKTIPAPVAQAAAAVKQTDTKNITVNPTSWQELAKNNPQIKNPNLIYPGQEITLPGTNEKYVVQKGDTLSGIAKWYNRDMIPNKSVQARKTADVSGPSAAAQQLKPNASAAATAQLKPIAAAPATATQKIPNVEIPAAPAKTTAATPAPAPEKQAVAAPVISTTPKIPNPYTGADAVKFSKMSPKDQEWLTRGGLKPDLSDKNILSRAPYGGKLEPISIRNNNPGNLRYAGQPGAVKDPSGFARFENPAAGMAAMTKQIELDTQKRGMNLTGFINKYAPRQDNNDTDAYINNMATALGIDPNQRIPADKIPMLQRAMIRQEGGRRAVDAYYPAPEKPSVTENRRKRRGEETEMDYDDPEWTSKVERLRKLAGMGPLKTVWDPVKRVYKNVPVNDKKEVKEYGNAQDPNNQTTSPDATGAAQQDMQTSMQSNTTQQAAELAKQKAAQQQDVAIARNTAGGLTNVLPPGANPDAMASGITKMSDGKPLDQQEQQAVSQITPLVMKAAETPGLAGQLKSALQTAGVLAKQGK